MMRVSEVREEVQDKPPQRKFFSRHCCRTGPTWLPLKVELGHFSIKIKELSLLRKDSISSKIA